MRLPTHASPIVLASVAGLLVAFAPACSRPARLAASPGERDAAAANAAAANAACEACHAPIAREWRSSLHHDSHTDPVYQRAFAREPLPFCTGCHAPEANPEATGPSAAHALGVGCVTCHTVATSHGTPSAARSHTEDCASCHEFTFPGSSEKMQLTATEHRASRSADVSCASCHMPRVATGSASHLDHRFEASRDADLLRSAARITAVWAGRSVTFTLTPLRVGHALPTGDIFRRLRLVVVLADRRVETTLGRKTKRADALDAPNAADDRPFVRGQPARVDLDLGDGARPLAWRVFYERVEHPTSRDERDALVEGTVELASGTFP